MRLDDGMGMLQPIGAAVAWMAGHSSPGWPACPTVLARAVIACRAVVMYRCEEKVRR